MNKQITDNELLYLIRSGNIEARNFLLEKYHFFIYRIISDFNNSLCYRHLDYSDCYSVCQIAFLKCIRTFYDGQNFCAYLKKAFQHALHKYWKEEYSEGRNTDIKATDYQTICDKQYVSDVREEYYGEELEKFLISHLPEKEKEIVEYRLRGYTGVEIARMMGMTIKSYYRRMDKIKALISENF